MRPNRAIGFTKIALTFGIAGPVTAAIELVVVVTISRIFGLSPNDVHSRTWESAVALFVVPALYFVIPGIVTGLIVGWSALKGWMPFDGFWRVAIISIAIEFLYLAAIPGPMTAMGVVMLVALPVIAAIAGAVCWWLARGFVYSSGSHA